MGEQRAGISGPIVALIALCAFLVGGIGGFGVGCSTGQRSAPAGTSAPDYSGLSDYNVDAPASTTTTAPAVPPKPSDFRVDVTVIEQKCFGSAGCNYRLNVNPILLTTADIAGDWKVIYQITGGEDPQTGNFTISGGKINWDDEKRIQGPASASFSARVTQVLRAY